MRHNLFFGFIYFLYFCVVPLVTQTEIQNLEIQNCQRTDAAANRAQIRMDKSLPAADSINQVPVQDVFDNR